MSLSYKVILPLLSFRFLHTADYMKQLFSFCSLLMLGVFTLCPLVALAQDEEYYNNAWWNCELTGNQTKWVIKQYREGFSFVTKMVPDNGHIIFSDDCIEIKSNNMYMHFPVAKYNRISEDAFSVTRNGEDDYFDYIECVKGRGNEKGAFRFMIAMLDPDSTMQNTHLFICQPSLKLSGKNIKEAMEKGTKDDGTPVQVPKKR